MTILETVRHIHCCECERKVFAHLVTGKEVYPHRKDLYNLPFWRCQRCKNFVGCHHKTQNRTKPLGVIANKELKKARLEIHKILDPLWKSGKLSRRKLYKMLSEKLGYQYHTASIEDIEEARVVYGFIQQIRKGIFGDDKRRNG